jgi:putative Mg2+ transporter-C (MgtC) family protein
VIAMSEIDFIWHLFPKIIVATICGLIVGWERELKNKVAGIRTHVLVCVGACLFTVIAIVTVPQSGDYGRIIGQIVTGVGFLGAGVIFKHDDKIVGVTSASLIWFIAAIGVLTGIGYLVTSIVLTAGLLVLLILLKTLEEKIK